MIVEAQVTMNGTRAAVWSAVSDIRGAADILSGVQKIEILEKPATGLVGLRWRETRLFFGESAAVEKWITAAVEGELYETRAELDGFVFITNLGLSGIDGDVVVTSSHETRPQGLLAKVKSLPMIFFRGVLRKAILEDLDDLKRFVERR
ncbi:MAG: SRPBCC family protein [Anaeromyxobacteraceae bacterium]